MLRSSDGLYYSSDDEDFSDYETPENVLNAILENLANKILRLPSKAREPLIESFTTLLLRGFVPMSGMTLQQHTFADHNLLVQLNSAMEKQFAYINSTDARYAYQFAREATSAGIIPAYRDIKTGEIYIALVCNKRNLKMYNWSAGYTEAPLPRWREKLLSDQNREVYYDRNKIINSATKTMKKIME